MNNSPIGQFFSFLVYTVLQVFLLRELDLFNIAFPFVYIAIILLIAREVNVLTTMLIGFALGLLVDAFANTTGVHAGACVFLAYMREKVLRWTEPSGGYETWMQPRANIMGFQWFATYTILLTLFHHFALFVLEAATFSNFGLTITKIIASTLYTTIIITLFQYIFYEKRVGMR